MQSEFSGKEAELVPGVLRGYREWRLAARGGLAAMNFLIPWGRGKNTAGCAKGFPHFGIPEAHCTCGFYARHEPTGLGIGGVVGSIKAYGKVILGTLGFRAQYVEIEALTAPYQIWDLLSATREIYQVDIFGSLDQLVQAHPPIPVDVLLKDDPVSLVAKAEEAYLKQWRDMSRVEWKIP